MKKIVLYAHGGSGNHGCEALVRTTAELMKKVNGEYPSVISSHPKEDQKFITNIPLQFIPKGKGMSSLQRLMAKFYKLFTHSLYCYDRVEMQAVTRDIKDSICISIGGDNYCYSDFDYYGRMNTYLNRHNNQTVLWGCSVEPNLLNNSEVLNDLRKYRLITARETLTYNAMIDAGLTNVCLVPDPAFMLPIQKTALPKIFEKSVVGINISPMVLSYEKEAGSVITNYINLIDYILTNTDNNIALIPHVRWSFNDDLEPLLNIYEKYKGSERIELIDREGILNCCQLKYIISKCSFMVVARTHASIAAYSTGVPTLVMGYSVKAKGIAKDIFGDYENYVSPAQNMYDDNCLLNQYIRLSSATEALTCKELEYTDMAVGKMMSILEVIKRWN